MSVAQDSCAPARCPCARRGGARDSANCHVPRGVRARCAGSILPKFGGAGHPPSGVCLNPRGLEKLSAGSCQDRQASIVSVSSYSVDVGCKVLCPTLVSEVIVRDQRWSLRSLQP